MNQVITIPRKIVARGDLVLIPKKEYDDLVRLRNTTPPKKELSDLEIGLAEIREGKTIGPFYTVDALMASLLGTKKSKRRK